MVYLNKNNITTKTPSAISVAHRCSAKPIPSKVATPLPPLKLNETYHYKYVIGEKDDYINYINKNIGVWLLHNDHSPSAFDELINNFSMKRIGKIIIDKDGLVYDGLHRLSILLSKGYNKVKMYQII